MPSDPVAVAVITTLLAPVALLFVGLIVDVARARWLKQPSASTPEPPPVAGSTVGFDPAQTLYRDILHRLEREEGEHAQCHTAMRAHDLPIPHD